MAITRPRRIVSAELDLGLRERKQGGPDVRYADRMGVDGPLVAPDQVLDGKYVVERVLGQGGMGIVVAARHSILRTKVALKLLLPEARDPESVERFHREARSAVRIQSVHAARVHDVGQLEDGTPYMVMDLLTGIDLEGLVRERGALAPQEAVAFALQAIDALREAHALGIIHRDLKPANLFLATQNEGPPIVKVLDFGIARDFEESTEPRLTRTGDVMGSPAYMSPEQMRGARSADTRSDLWALGACLYEMLTGRLPFEGKTLADLCANVQRGTPPPPESWRPEVPLALSRIVLRCLEKDPARRFQTASELADALVAWKSAPSPVQAAQALAYVSTAPPRPPIATRTTRMEPAPAVARTSAPRRNVGWAVGLALGATVAAVLTSYVVLRPSSTLPPGPVAQAESSPLPPTDPSTTGAPEPPPLDDPPPLPQNRTAGAEPPAAVSARPPAGRTVRPSPASPSASASSRAPAPTPKPTFDPKSEF
jgi:eukaryotic-like serine/threonine-protein kinase